MLPLSDGLGSSVIEPKLASFKLETVVLTSWYVSFTQDIGIVLFGDLRMIVTE